MNELRGSLLTKGGLNDVDLTLKPLNCRDFISAVQSDGAILWVVHQSVPEAMQYRN